MKSTHVTFTATRDESELISLIAERFINLCNTTGYPHDPYMTVLMDLEACHCNGTPLALDRLLVAANADLMHDVAGIRRHINRETGEIEGCFLPRYALPSPVLA